MKFLGYELRKIPRDSVMHVWFGKHENIDKPAVVRTMQLIPVFLVECVCGKEVIIDTRIEDEGKNSLERQCWVCGQKLIIKGK